MPHLLNLDFQTFSWQQSYGIYVNGCHLGCRSGSPDTILKVYFQRMICHACFKLTYWFWRRFLHISTMLNCLAAILDGGQALGHISERGSPNNILYSTCQMFDRNKRRMCPWDTDGPAPKKFLYGFSTKYRHNHKFYNFVLHKGT